MSGKTAHKIVVVNNEQGLHARPADLLVRLAQQFESKIEIVKGNERVDAKSILSILTLAAGQGTVLKIEATGNDAEQMIVAISELIESGFPDPKTADQP